MPLGDQAFYDRFIRRVTWIILALALTGSAVLAIVKEIRIGLAFLIGATVSYASFWGWRQLVDALTPGPKKRSAVPFVVRILLLIALAYAIIRFLGLNVAAAASGLLVSAAAVLLELIFELIYART
ncbi:MAG TPA: ATP synthase subunit I [Bryobacteraceae bacterium]|nr:ATP synthase subunit I [Bryobacteraceae bacterium]